MGICLTPYSLQFPINSILTLVPEVNKQVEIGQSDAQYMWYST